MLVMVSFVGLLIFIYSVGYMAHDENFTRFFCFLSLFAAAMLGLVIANSLLLLFICMGAGGLDFLSPDWFLVSQAERGGGGKESVHHHPYWRHWRFSSGMVWLYSQSGTLLFYDDGKGCSGRRRR